MIEKTGIKVHFSFESGDASPEDAARLTADIWTDLPFDREALAALKRDGLALDGINLGGPCPYQFARGENGNLEVSATGPDAETLLDLWRVHFLRGLRPRTLSA